MNVPMIVDEAPAVWFTPSGFHDEAPLIVEPRIMVPGTLANFDIILP
jgi:hypothetical protein